VDPHDVASDARSGFARFDSDSLLAEQAFYRLARLRAAFEPVFNPLFVELDAQLGLFVRRVVGAQLFDHVAVAGRTLVHCRYPVRRLMPPPDPLQTNPYHSPAPQYATQTGQYAPRLR